MILRDYQDTLSTQAVDVLRRLHICYLAIHVRVGKTLIALATAEKYGARSVLFVTKIKAITSIKKDFAAIGYDYKLHVTNYEQVKKLNPDDYDFIICDEAHNLKKFPKPSLRAKEVYRMVGYRPLMLLSGTPSPESYSELFHQFWISQYSPFRTYKNFYAWARVFVDVFEEKHGQFTVNNYSRAHKDELMNIINPYMITYTQEEAKFSCPVIEKIHYVESRIIPSMIKELFKNRIITIGSDSVVADSPAKLLTKMHQISGGTVIGENETHFISDSKANYIKNTFAGKHIAIFYKFQAELDILTDTFPNHTFDTDEFRTTNKTYLTQVISGREGIALDTADAIVMYSIDFAAVSYWQARARLQALHRSTPAEVHWIFTEGAIEPKIYKAVSDKKDFTLSFFIKNGGLSERENLAGQSNGFFEPTQDLPF